MIPLKLFTLDHLIIIISAIVTFLIIPMGFSPVVVVTITFPLII